MNSLTSKNCPKEANLIKTKPYHFDFENENNRKKYHVLLLIRDRKSFHVLHLCLGLLLFIKRDTSQSSCGHSWWVWLTNVRAMSVLRKLMWPGCVSHWGHLVCTVFVTSSPFPVQLGLEVHYLLGMARVCLSYCHLYQTWVSWRLTVQPHRQPRSPGKFLSLLSFLA